MDQRFFGEEEGAGTGRLGPVLGGPREAVLLGLSQEIGPVLLGERCCDVRVGHHWKLLAWSCLMQRAPDDAICASGAITDSLRIGYGFGPPTVRLHRRLARRFAPSPMGHNGAVVRADGEAISAPRPRCSRGYEIT